MPRIDRLEKRNVAILAASQSLFLVATITVMTLSGVVGYRLSPVPSLATLPVAMMMFGTVLTTLPASLMMKRIGRRRGFLVGAALGGVGGGVTAFAAIAWDAFWLFCAGNLLLGLYQGFAMYYRFAAADVASPAFRNRAISLVLAGGVVAAFLGPWNASLTNHWLAAVPDGAPFLMVAGLALVAMALLHCLRVPRHGAPQAGERVRPLAVIGAQPRFRVAVLAAAMGYAVMVLVMSATPLAMRVEGFDMAAVALVMQGHILGMFLPSFVTGTLMSRVGVVRLLLAGALILGLSSVIAVAGAGLEHFGVALVLLGVGWNFLFIGGSALLAEVHRDSERGKVQGVNDLVVFSLVTLASLLAGHLLSRLGWVGLHLLLLPAVLGIAVAVFWLVWHEARASIAA